MQSLASNSYGLRPTVWTRTSSRNLQSVAKTLSGAMPQFTPVKVALVGDGTLSLVASPIEGSGLRHGVLIDVVLGGYNAVVHESFDETSAVQAAKPDLVVLATDCRILGLSRATASREAANDLVEAAFARTRMIVERMRKSARGGVIVQTVPGPTDSLFGSFDRVEANVALRDDGSLQRASCGNGREAAESSSPTSRASRPRSATSAGTIRATGTRRSFPSRRSSPRSTPT